METTSDMKAVPHDELCDRALGLYEKMVATVLGPQDLSNVVIPAAIKFYKEHYVRRGERKIVRTPGKLMEALEEGWMFDPWLNTRGGPTIIGDQPYKGEHPALSAVDPREPSVYWVLVKGTPEQIAALEPFVELPVEELEEAPEPGVQPYGLRTMFIAYNAIDGAGEPMKPPEDFVIMHKDHIFAKGTVYTLPPGYPTLWTVAKDLAKLSGYLGVDEARDVLAAILEKSSSGNEGQAED